MLVKVTPMSAPEAMSHSAEGAYVRHVARLVAIPRERAMADQPGCSGMTVR
jgi:hypothetical protein